MHKQHPQTAYRKYAILIGTIFENCDKKDSCVFLFRSCLHFYPLVRASISMTVLHKISFPPVNREKDCFLSVFVVSLFAGKALFCKCSGHASLLGVIVRVIVRRKSNFLSSSWRFDCFYMRYLKEDSIMEILNIVFSALNLLATVVIGVINVTWMISRDVFLDKPRAKHYSKK